jgi:zinc protease
MDMTTSQLTRAGALSIAFLLAAAAPAAAADGWGEAYTLANGLRVVLSPDARAHTLAVLVRYHAGVRNEPRGRSGMSHLLEHLRLRIPEPRERPTLGLPPTTPVLSNGATSYASTDYYTIAPRGSLKYALWNERWRMRADLDFITDSVRAQEVAIIANERRERHEIKPFVAARRAYWSQLFPEGHVFHEEVIGSAVDVAAATLDEVRAYFRALYGPNNSTLVVTGAFDPVEARAIIEEYFAPVPAPAASILFAAKPTSARVPVHELVLHVEDPLARRPFVLMAWPEPEPIERAAGEMTALVLGGLTANRLERAVPQSTLVEATQVDGLGAGAVFQIVVEPPPGMALEAVVRQIDGALEELRTRPPTQAEVDAGVRRLVRDRWRAEEEPLERAFLLADRTPTAGGSEDPLAEERRRCSAVRPEEVRAFAATYLARERRVTVFSTSAGGSR